MPKDPNFCLVSGIWDALMVGTICDGAIHQPPNHGSRVYLQSRTGGTVGLYALHGESSTTLSDEYAVHVQCCA